MVIVSMAVMICAAQEQSFGEQKVRTIILEDGTSLVVGANTPIRFLDEVLRGLEWDAATYGPLLAVGGQQLPILAPLPEGKFLTRQRLPEFLTRVNRQLVRTGGVSVIIPQTVQTIIVPKESVAEHLTRSPQEAALTLFASLSERQWGILTGTGLGINDLDNRQRRLFERILPQPFMVQSFPLTSEGGLIIYPKGDPNNPIQTLPEQARQQVRLQLSRQLDWSFFLEGNRNSRHSFGVVRRPPGQMLHKVITAEAQERPHSDGLQKVVNVPKRSELDFQQRTLDTMVSLADIKTVGELIARVGKVCPSELWADRRVAALSVQIWGEQARAGDILEALARSVGGTYRKISDGNQTLFLLTQDIEGIYSRTTRLEEWKNQLDFQRQEVNRVALKGIQKMRERVTLDFAPHDAFSLSTELTRRVDALARSDVFGRAIFPIAELPAGLRERIIPDPKLIPSKIPLDSKELQLMMKTELMFLVPGVGGVEPESSLHFSSELSTAFFDKERTLPPTVAPTVVPGGIAALKDWNARVAIVAPRTPQEVVDVIRTAGQAGLTELWLEVPPSKEKAGELLTLAIAEGKKYKLAVGAFVRPFHPRSSDVPQGAGRDLNPVLETESTVTRRYDGMERYVWANSIGPFEPGRESLALDASTGDFLLRQLMGIKNIPGLSCLALRDYVPLGYTYTTRAISELGYSPANRLAFIRQQSMDPIDLPPSNRYSSGGGITFFSNEGLQIKRPLKPGEEPASAPSSPFPESSSRLTTNTASPVFIWQKSRLKLAENAVKIWHEKLRQEAPQASLWIMPRGESWPSNMVMWENLEGLVQSWSVRFEPFPLNKIGSKALATLSPNAFLEADAWRQQVEQRAQKESADRIRRGKSDWEGFLFDLSGLDFAEALKYIKVL